MGQSDNYAQATRHPWSCILFLLPLLVAYEGGVLWMGGAEPEVARTGADTWVRWMLRSFGLPTLYWPPIIITVIFGVWSWLRRKDRPKDLPGVWLGMAVESVAFALLLWGFGRIHGPLFDRVGMVVAAQPSKLQPQLSNAISFLGAGIYEEMLFRLLLFSGILWALRKSDTPSNVAIGLAMILSALAFSAAHHLGPSGEPLHSRIFMFRALAGMYFAVLFQFRGFGIAVGTHACYDVLVGAAAG